MSHYTVEFDQQQNFTPTLTMQARHKPCVLLVEDELLVQYLTTTVLQSMGFSVVSVNSGATALEILKQRTFDYVLLDIGLPDLSGLDVCRLLRQREREQMSRGITFKRQTIIAYSCSYSMIDCLEAGADFYAAKPLMPNDLKQLIKTVDLSMCL